MPAIPISAAARPDPLKAARAPHPANELGQGQDEDGLFRQELTREMGVIQALTTAATDARDGAGPADLGKGDDARDATREPVSTVDTSAAAMLPGAVFLPATLVDATLLPAAIETAITDAPASAFASLSASTPAPLASSTSASVSAAAMAGTENVRGARPKWPGHASTDPNRPESMSALADSSPDGMEHTSERPRAEFALAASSTPAESAAAGKFPPAGRDALEPGVALRAEPAQRHAAETPLPAGMNMGASAPPQVTHTATATIATQLAAPGWDRGLGEKIVWMAGKQMQLAELHLNPPELGPLQIALTINNDQASAQFVSQHAAVREAIEAAMPRLREMLAEGGITLGNTSVSADSFGAQTPGQQDSRNRIARSAEQADTGSAFRVTQLLRATRGLVDIFA